MSLQCGICGKQFGGTYNGENKAGLAAHVSFHVAGLLDKFGHQSAYAKKLQKLGRERAKLIRAGQKGKLPKISTLLQADEMIKYPIRVMRYPVNQYCYPTKRHEFSRWIIQPGNLYQSKWCKQCNYCLRVIL